MGLGEMSGLYNLGFIYINMTDKDMISSKTSCITEGVPVGDEGNWSKAVRPRMLQG